MGYTKQNFKSGDVLLASQLNAMDSQIESNALAINEKQDKGEYVTSDEINCNVKAINHRGYSAEAPENTIPAYIMSKQKGFAYVEGDVSFTKDSVAVLLHDATIDRTSNGKGDITTLTYEQVLQYDFGSWFSSKYAGVKIPTFKEWIICCKNLGLHPYIELKSAGNYTQAQINQVVNEVAQCGMKGKVTYISFSNTFLNYVKTADASARLGFLVSSPTTGSVTTTKNLRTTTNEVFLDAKLANVKESVIKSCITNNIPLEVWTVNTEKEILNMSPYICGVTSDNLIAGKVLYENSLIYVPPVSNYVPTNSVSLSQTSLSFENKEPIKLTATLDPSNASDPIVWNTSNSSIATVSSGTVTPIADGECNITATSDGKQATCSVLVNFIKYTISNSLLGCTLSNGNTSVTIGNAFTTNVIPSEGYSLKNANISIKMDNVDITSTAYNNGVISIANVSGNITIEITCVEVPVYTITRNLVGCTSNSTLTNIGEGNPYTETFTVSDGYKFNGATISITMGDKDITLDAYHNNVLSIVEVTGNIVINITAVQLATYTITRNLVGCTSNSSINTVREGDTHTEIFTLNDNYVIDKENTLITMGYSNITSYLQNNVLTIPNVQGNIDIQINAIEVTGPVPVVDLNLTNVIDGVITNNGSGGETYNATLHTVTTADTYVADASGLKLRNHAYANVNYGFKASDIFTITLKGRITELNGIKIYQRIMRTNVDAPSLFYSKNSLALGAKLAGKSGNDFKTYNELATTLNNGSALNTCFLNGIKDEQGNGLFDFNNTHSYVWTSDGTTIKWYVDGILFASQNASALSGSTYVGLGDNDITKDYYANEIEVSEFKIYNIALTDEEIENEYAEEIIIESIELNTSNLEFTNWQSQTLTATTNPVVSSNNIMWISSNDLVATVNDGIVNPISNGNCVITAFVGDISANCNVIVNVNETLDVTPVVDLNLTNLIDGVIANTGSGGETYNATLHTVTTADTYVADASGLKLRNHAYANVNYGFKASDTFTILIKSRITTKSSKTYQRVMRTDVDAPSLFYSKNATALGAKMSGNSNDNNQSHNSIAHFPSSLNTCYLSFENESGFDESIMRKYVWTSDGTTIKWYVDGILMASQAASKLKESTYIGLGDNNPEQSYYANEIEIAKFKIYDEAIPENKINLL